MAGEAASGRAGLMEPEPAPALALVPVTARKPRGRPLGSKNKPKPPVVVTRESEAAMRPVVLELAAGCDVVSAVAAFARRRRVVEPICDCVLSPASTTIPIGRPDASERLGIPRDWR